MIAAEALSKMWQKAPELMKSTRWQDNPDSSTMKAEFLSAQQGLFATRSISSPTVGKSGRAATDLEKRWSSNLAKEWKFSTHSTGTNPNHLSAGNPGWSWTSKTRSSQAKLIRFRARAALQTEQHKKLWKTKPVRPSTCTSNSMKSKKIRKILLTLSRSRWKDLAW